ncbi:MAG: hypothetical protein AB1746_11805 [Candidatus Zixiibacteriota bacterium]
MITEQDLAEASRQFDEHEKRGSYYDMARNLWENGFRLEAYILLLATWNFAYFRYVIKDFELNTFGVLMDSLESRFTNLDGLRLSNIDINHYRDDIKKIYKEVSGFNGIKHTGAAKVMHLRNPELFVIWDDFIRGAKPIKYYESLNIVRKGKWKHRQYENNENGYFDFMVQMQHAASEVKNLVPGKTLAKLIDEYNYVNITLPIQEVMRRENEEKKNKRKKNKMGRQ